MRDTLRRHRPAVLLGLTIALMPSLARAQRPAPIEQVAWFAGCWSRSTATSVVEEQWMAPRGGAMLGMSRTVANNALREFEHLRVFTAGDTLVYASTPSRQQYTEFRSKTISADEVVFENATHDFPQRIGYRRVSRDSLLAYIEGNANGTPRRINFPYARVACPGATP
ncbi:MAG: DUF6265 family protein [Gemmatimonas sp.]